MFAVPISVSGVWGRSSFSMSAIVIHGCVVDFLFPLILNLCHDLVFEQWCLKVNERDSSFLGMGFFWPTLLLMGARWKLKKPSRPAWMTCFCLVRLWIKIYLFHKCTLYTGLCLVKLEQANSMSTYITTYIQPIQQCTTYTLYIQYCAILGRATEIL